MFRNGKNPSEQLPKARILLQTDEIPSELETERRTSMLSLLLAAIFFAGIHLGVAGTTWRDRAVAALGEGGYRAVFSIASLVGIIWLGAAYKYAPYVVTWGILEWWKPIAILLMLPAFLLAVIGRLPPIGADPSQFRARLRAGQPAVAAVRH